MTALLVLDRDRYQDGRDLGGVCKDLLLRRSSWAEAPIATARATPRIDQGAERPRSPHRLQNAEGQTHGDLVEGRPVVVVT
jgi:hypothetical protein